VSVLCSSRRHYLFQFLYSRQALTYALRSVSLKTERPTADAMQYIVCESNEFIQFVVECSLIIGLQLRLASASLSICAQWCRRFYIVHD